MCHCHQWGHSLGGCLGPPPEAPPGCGHGRDLLPQPCRPISCSTISPRAHAHRPATSPARRSRTWLGHSPPRGHYRPPQLTCRHGGCTFAQQFPRARNLHLRRATMWVVYRIFPSAFWAQVGYPSKAWRRISWGHAKALTACVGRVSCYSAPSAMSLGPLADAGHARRCHEIYSLWFGLQHVWFGQR